MAHTTYAILPYRCLPNYRKTGTNPDESDVREGIQYGLNGTEFTGTLVQFNFPLEIIDVTADVEVIEI